MIRVQADHWFLVFCPCCDGGSMIPIDPRLVSSFACPRCFNRFDAAPRHGAVGFLDPSIPRVRLGEGLYYGLPEGLEHAEYE